MISGTPEQLMMIACRAIEHHKAQNMTRQAKHAYHKAWQKFETGDFHPLLVHPDERISRHHPQFEEACSVTKEEHDAYQAAKRAEYNAKRRLETAIRGVK